MAKILKLKAQTRSGTGRQAAKHLRASGSIPANFYGAKTAPANLQVDEREISTLLSHAVGENLLVDIEIEDNGKTATRTALIQEVQHEPISGRLIHIDFHEVSMDETIHTDVMIEPVGIADGVRNFGGLLEQSLRQMTIECLPKDLPEIITVDVSALGLGKSLHVRDIPLPEGVRSISDPDLTVFLVSEPRVDTTARTEATPSQPEVLKEKKKDESA